MEALIVDIRWQQRLQNFEKAHLNLIEMLALLKEDESSKAYKLASIQAYEMDMELAWKTLKDYLNYLAYNVQAPREVIKQAFSAEIIEDGDIWLRMLDDRNLTSHVYDEVKAQEIVDSIVETYFSKLDTLYRFLKGESND